MPDVRLHVHGHRPAAKHEVDFDITSKVILESKPGKSRPFMMLATRLHLSWSWHTSGPHAGQWHLMWCFHGRRYRKTSDDWSPHEQGFMSDWDIDLPAWVQPLIEANAPTAPPVVVLDTETEEVSRG
ncbi:hypothetical protein [Microbispora rosea]|uniref:hypothetical protein n=1 Tax=Microbispora rosea TaxID=58117 RepID=UPI0004C45BB6|nr:hypothetical protein [Microbispora rosea]